MHVVCLSSSHNKSAPSKTPDTIRHFEGHITHNYIFLRMVEYRIATGYSLGIHTYDEMEHSSLFSLERVSLLVFDTIHMFQNDVLYEADTTCRNSYI